MEQIILNLVPGGVSPVCYVSQYDVGRKIRLHLRNGSDPYVLSGAETVTATIRKVSGEELIYDIANTSASYVDLIVNYDATDVIGESVCELIITESGTRLGSANFKMRIDPDVYSGDQKLEVVSATSETPDLSFETNVEENLLELKAGFSPVQDLHGYDSPWPAGGGKNKINPDTVELSNLTVSDGIYSATDGDDRDTLFFKLQGFIGNTYSGYQVTTPPIVQTGKISLKITIPNNIDTLRFANAGQTKEFSFKFPCPFPEETVATFSCNFLDITMGAVKFKDPQLEIGSTATDYEPYANICEIKGWNEVNVIGCGVNLVQKQSGMQLLNLASGTTLYFRLFNSNANFSLYGLPVGLPDVVSNWERIGGFIGQTLQTVTTTKAYSHIGISASAYSDLGDGDIQVSLSSFDTFTPYSGKLINLDWNTNQWDEEWEQGGINSTTGANSSESGCIRSKNYIRVYPGQTLYFKAPSTWTAHSVRGRCYKADGTYLQALSFFDNTVFTIPSDCYYFRFVTPSGADITAYNHDISINYPSTDHTYHPYRGHGVAYSGEVVYKDGGWKLRLIGAEVDLGSRTFSKHIVGSYTVFRCNEITDCSTTPTMLYLCSNYNAILGTRENLQNGDIGGWNTVNAYSMPTIRDDGKSNMTVEEFKSAMTGVKLVYPLATPIEIPLDQNSKLATVLGINNLMHDANGGTEVKFFRMISAS